ncbi:hypothetical protein DFH09DRAFT_1068265 [Mycena vulgaris]|nr:hypothetical protein DFH09DRAFT_1068265 [Mycena vulgaris]
MSKLRDMWVILVYDHLLTLGDEVEYVWPAKNTIAKILFLVFRYMVPVFLTIHTILLSGYITISIGSCGLDIQLFRRRSDYEFRDRDLEHSLITFNPVVGLCTFTAKPNLVGFWVVDVTQMLLRDGVVYFMKVESPPGLRTTNTVLSVAAPISLVGVFITWAGATITTSRLIINSRKNARQAIVKAQSHGPEEFGPSVSHGSSLSLAHTL